MRRLTQISAIVVGILSAAVLCAIIAYKVHNPEAPIVYRNVNYSDSVSNNQPEKEHQFDLLVPHSSTPVPLVVYLHGGGWITGDKSYNPAVWIWKRGYAIASINYRLAPGAKYPAQRDDCIAAVKYLRKHAIEYNIDPDKIALFGVSSGAHVVASAALSNALAGDVKAVCIWSAPSNFTTIDAQEGENKTITKCIAALLGGTPSQLPNEAAKASPALTIQAKQQMPAFLLMHGEKDSVVPFAQSKDFCVALQKAGADATLIPVPAGEHDFYAKKYMALCLDFFDEKM